MRQLTALLLTFFAAATQARSLDPCTPRIEAAPSYLQCSEGEHHYSITFHTLMSGPECSTHRELTSATIIVSAEGGIPYQIDARPGTFTYRLDDRFDSESLGLHLRGCISPMHGGFSIGN